MSEKQTTERMIFDLGQVQSNFDVLENALKLLLEFNQEFTWQDRERIIKNALAKADKPVIRTEVFFPSLQSLIPNTQSLTPNP